MKTKFSLLLVSITILALALAGCAPAAATGTVVPTAAEGGVETMAPATAAPTIAPPTTAPTMAAATMAPTTPAETVAPTTAATPAGTAAAVQSALPNLTPDPNLNAKIALLLPETKTTRYETADRPYFTERLNELCPNCEIIYSNANQDASQQLSQAQAALTNGANVLVLDPVDSASASAIADQAAAQGVPVIAYDRLILNTQNVDYYISFDNRQVGVLQAQSLMNALNNMQTASPPTIVMINGAPTDNNASLFKEGAHSVFDPLVANGQLKIGAEYDTPDWSPDQAQNEMQQALTALNNQVDGVYAANDGTASGAIAAMKAAGVSPIPPVTGQDAELAAIQRIVAGTQYMTVYKAIKPEAYTAAELAFALASNTSVDVTTQPVNNGTTDVKSVLLTPIAVTQDNIMSTIVADNFWTVDQICTQEYAADCQNLGIKEVSLNRAPG